MSTGSRGSRSTLVSTVLPGIALPVVFIAIGLWAQSHLGAAWHQDWWIAVLAFVVGGLTLLLPRQFPLLATLIAMVFFAWLGTRVAMTPITLACFVLAGLGFGSGVRSLIVPPKSTSKRTAARS